MCGRPERVGREPYPVGDTHSAQQVNLSSEYMSSTNDRERDARSTIADTSFGASLPVNFVGELVVRNTMKERRNYTFHDALANIAKGPKS